jgi:predicted phage tail protein
MAFARASATVLVIAFLLLPRSSDAATLGLAWDPPSDGVTVGYLVWYGTTPGTYTQSIDVATTTSYTVGNLADGTTYYLAVQGYNATRQGGPLSAEVIGATRPATPLNLTATVRQGLFIDLNWQAPSGSVAAYRIEVGTATGLSNVATINTGTATTFTISNLSAGMYFIRVRSVSSAGVTSAAGNEVVATLLAIPAPPASLSAAVRDNQFIDLTWQAPLGTLSGYRIEVGTAAGQSDVTTINTGTATTYTIGNLPAGRYYIRVRSVNIAGVSVPSNEVVVTRASAPAPPSNLTAATRSDQYVDLTWQAPSGTLTGYRIEVGTAAGQSDVTTINTGTATTSTISNLAAGTYYIRVRAVNSAGISSPSNEVVVTLGAGPAPPTNLAASVRRRHVIDLTWQAPSTGASSYRVEIGTTSGQNNTRSVTTTATRLTISDLRAGVYYIRVRSVNAAGVSAPSNEVIAGVVRGGRPLPPDNLSATLRDGRLIDLSWDGDDEALFYRVEVGTAPGQTDVSSFTTGVTTSFTIGELPTKTYYIRVRSANDEGTSDPTADVVVGGVGGSNAPQRLSAAVAADHGVHLIWDAPLDPAGVIGYVIEAGTGRDRTDLGTIHTNERSLRTTPVPNGTYFVRVRSVTATGPSSASNEVVVLVGTEQQCTAPPAAPRFEANVVGSFVELSWSAGAGDLPTGYLLDVGTAPGRRDIASMPLSADVTRVTTTVQNGTYALRLTAVNACGASAWGSDVTLTMGGPEVTLPGAPSALTQQVIGQAVTLTWSPSTSGGQATGYVIEVRTPTGQLLLSLYTGNLSTLFTHGNAPSGQYMVQVRATNARGAGAASNAVSVVVP